MADDINKAMLVGRLTRDSELQYTNSGYALCKFSLAVNRRKKQGETWVDEANYFDINLWGRRGESLNQYLIKGAQVAIEGQLRQERWEKDGVKRSKVTIEAVNIQLLGGNRDQVQQGGQRPPQQQAPAQGRNQSYNSQENPRDYERYIPTPPTRAGAER